MLEGGTEHVSGLDRGDETTVQRCPSCGSIAVYGRELELNTDRPACPSNTCLVETFRATRWGDEESIREEIVEIKNVESSIIEIPIWHVDSETPQNDGEGDA
jgi:acetyl-CoA carboxylase beta subunit